MRLSRLLLGALAVLAISAAAPAQTSAEPTAQAQPNSLLPGDKAPQIKVAEWVQGKPIKSFEKGRVYVVEFWATWCGPCIDSIPHLNEIAKKNAAKVDVVGVNIWEEAEGRQERVKKFVQDMGEKMSYRVAIDTDDNDTTASYMDASMSEGIPTAFIVNEDGVIAWIGHPMSLEEPLNAVLAKKHDIAAARKDYEAQMESARKRRELYAQIEEANNLYASGKKQEAIAKLDELAKNEEIGLDAKITKLGLLAGDDVPAAKTFITELSKGESDDQLTAAIFSIQNATDPEGKRDLALFAAKEVVANSKKDDAFVLYYCSPAFSVTGDHKRAIEVLERALKAFDSSEMAKDPQMKDFRTEIEKAIAEEKKQIG